MEIIIERDSVCMGDDCLAPHTRTYTLNDQATYTDLFECLKKDHYFPYISGNNVVWVLKNDHIDCIFSYFTKTDKFSVGLVEKSLKNICRNSNKLHLRYFSSPRKWKERIYQMYSGDEYTLWRDGWTDEIKYCDFLMGQ